jgi:hypothetical protein
MGFPHGHWKIPTFVGALTMRGIIAPFVLGGAINHYRRRPRRLFRK